jgi:4-alpha-glucanotransferase
MVKKKTTFDVSSQVDKPKSLRSAGILLHITSLPSAFAIGDLGPESKKFVDFLSRSKQRYWQLLPLNPTGPEQGYSPYSSISSLAGNMLLVSPEQMVSDGLLNKTEIDRHKVTATNKVNFQFAHEIRQQLFQRAYFNALKKKTLLRPFLTFCEREEYWLNDFALFVGLKQHHGNMPWYDWPDQYKFRNTRSLEQFRVSNVDTIRYVKWQQFIFFRQWKILKSYANQAGVHLFGDLPFYVSLDSADVWANPAIFSISKKGKMMGVSGVPPDYFNKNGQLWGMPTFRWDVLKKTKYTWWLQRIRKNMKLYDRLRLDHFRAFVDYWEVPEHHATAIRGKWKKGPGEEFFHTLWQTFGDLPFVAEDLGDINAAVYSLRDKFKLAGMKVLQFAFGDAMPTSAYIPHNFTSNFVVYTGTHDNNTTLGWFRKNVSKKERSQIEKYVGSPVDEKNIVKTLSRLAYATVADTVIVPMQDVLGLDEKARMNTPASVRDNWEWRFKSNALTGALERRLREWAILYNRV